MLQNCSASKRSSAIADGCTTIALSSIIWAALVAGGKACIKYSECPNSRYLGASRQPWVRFSWLAPTPFGFPEVPDVYIIWARSWGFALIGGGSASPRSSSANDACGTHRAPGRGGQDTASDAEHKLSA